jgi:redox-sensing transcriptional repressor
MRYHRIPSEAVRRLPVYLRGLQLLAGSGRKTISSTALAEVVNVNASQIRKDFSYFGDFGKRGVGYDIKNLARHIKRILKLDVRKKAALIGVGNLGAALLAYVGFDSYGFDIAAAFDSDPRKIGKNVAGIVAEDVAAIGTLADRDIHLAIIAVPGSAAQEVADALVAAGVRGILNFSPMHVTVPAKVKVITIDIATELARLPYYMPAAEVKNTAEVARSDFA